MKSVAGFQHTPGTHCGSTALRDLLHHIGIDLSEAMCFGLGSGLGFYYFRGLPAPMPSHLFYGRTLSLERDLCAHLGLEFEQGADPDAERAWRTAKEWIDRGVPLLLHVELSQLPHYRTRTLFPGHRVILAGYDDARGVALIADTQFPGLLEVLYEALRAAWAAQIPPIPSCNEWLAITPSTSVAPSRPPIPPGAAMIAALRDNALGMALDRAPHQAIMGMEMLAEDFDNWGTAPDWAVCARFGYQNIDVRGTGGGFFRKMYAQFLGGVGEVDERVLRGELAQTMGEIASEWSRLGQVLNRIALEQDRAAFSDASRAIRRLAMREENFWGKVLDTVGQS